MSELLIDKISAIIEPVVEVLGFELWGCELHGQGRHNVLRVYIDKADGVTVDDCAHVSNQISAVLNVEDLIQGAYDLEVSSPGLDRSLYKEEQYRRYIGEKVKIRLHVGVNKQRNFVGVIAAVDSGKLELLADEKRVEILINSVEKAKLIPEF